MAAMVSNGRRGQPGTTWAIKDGHFFGHRHGSGQETIRVFQYAGRQISDHKGRIAE
jgi:hypothetical protein